MGRAANPHPTEKEARVLEYIEDYYDAEGIPPTMREITHALGFNYHSHAQYFLLALVKKGYLRKARGRGGYLPVKR